MQQILTLTIKWEHWTPRVEQQHTRFDLKMQSKSTIPLLSIKEKDQHHDENNK